MSCFASSFLLLKSGWSSVSLEEFKVYGYAVFSGCEVSGYELMPKGGFAFCVVEVDVDAFYVFAAFVVEGVIENENGVFYVLGV